MGNVVDYQAKLQELAAKLKEQQPAMATLNAMADEIKAIKLSKPAPKAGAASDQLQEAVAAANEMTEKLGVQSPEAKVAWSVVEEIASSGTGNAMGGALTAEECLVDIAIEACEALDELNRALDSKNGKQE